MSPAPSRRPRARYPTPRFIMGGARGLVSVAHPSFGSGHGATTMLTVNVRTNATYIIKGTVGENPKEPNHASLITGDFGLYLSTRALNSQQQQQQQLCNSDTIPTTRLQDVLKVEVFRQTVADQSVTYAFCDVCCDASPYL
jgi:hypothetical protein